MSVDRVNTYRLEVFYDNGLFTSSPYFVVPASRNWEAVIHQGVVRTNAALGQHSYFLAVICCRSWDYNFEPIINNQPFHNGKFFNDDKILDNVYYFPSVKLIYLYNKLGYHCFGNRCSE
ncbi:hypothetical protein QQZ08_005888 [Neonectria magnoliae]|uniref:Uncharacterized protein n=1 Tax=Neonectria magnoliae TaxID=2732573 RepID=A0ABR1I281_9HYPO